MTRGRRTTLAVFLSGKERAVLTAMNRSTTIQSGPAKRARIVLLLANGNMPICRIAVTVGISRRFVYKWAQRFLSERIDGLYDKKGRGRKKEIIV